MKRDSESSSAATGSDDFLVRFLPGTSPAVLRLRERVSQLNSSRKLDLIRTILIRGETGAGKNHLAAVIAAHRRWRAIKNNEGDPGLDGGLRAFDDRFVEIHLPAIPETLLESELFGHKKGAFTGADRDKRGLLAGGKADDILLDEFGDIPGALQAKLLGVIEHRRFRPLGAEDEEEMSARLLMATNRPLELLVREQKFREDLYHRARLFVVRVPALREQPENIEPLARQIERDIKGDLPVDLQDAGEVHLSESDMAWARTYDWPGNVRELKHAITRWYFEDGRRSLEQVVFDLRAEEGSASTTGEMSSVIAGLVRERLDGVLRHGGVPPGSLNELVKQFEREVKIAVSTWNRSNRPTEEQLRQIFPDMGLDSIRNKLSSWRKS